MFRGSTNGIFRGSTNNANTYSRSLAVSSTQGLNGNITTAGKAYLPYLRTQWIYSDATNKVTATWTNVSGGYSPHTIVQTNGGAYEGTGQSWMM